MSGATETKPDTRPTVAGPIVEEDFLDHEHPLVRNARLYVGDWKLPLQVKPGMLGPELQTADGQPLFDLRYGDSYGTIEVFNRNLAFLAREAKRALKLVAAEARCTDQAARIAALENALKILVSNFDAATSEIDRTGDRAALDAVNWQAEVILANLGLADLLRGNPTEAEEAVAS